MRKTTLDLSSSLQRAAAAIIIALSSLGAHAQTYFYLDQIMVTPASPTTADAITITVNGSLSSTASFIVNTSWALNGNTVQLSVNADNQGIGLDVLVPHSEDFFLGMLPAGTYMIAIAGSFMSDMAPTPEHQFVVSGGTPVDCDSLEIISVQWGAFTPEQIIVTAANGSSDLFDYPGFVLLDVDGDTLAKEAVNYFGIGVSPQQHVLNVQPGALIDGNTLTGQLHLWSWSYTEPECEWTGTWELCPAMQCTVVVPYLVNLGNSIVDAEIPYLLVNADGVEVAMGTFQLIDGIQSDYGSGVCLPVGEYFLSLEQIGVVGGQLFYGLATSVTGTQQIEEFYVQGTATNVLPFAMFEACIDGSNSIPVHPAAAALDLRTVDDRLVVGTSDMSRIGAFQLLDINGRFLRSGVMNAAYGELTLAGLARGAYVFHSERHGPARFIH